ncbi:MAG: unsaturated chondroitin disaccharide hydrolase [Cellvibrionaceae bacterium]|jgi:unsaturated chondroitin disaccharide hydrolase
MTTLITQLQDRIANNCSAFGTHFPNYGSGQQYVLKEDITWLSAFWLGMLWLCAANDENKDQSSIHLQTAESLLPKFQALLDPQNEIMFDHDLGFLYCLGPRAQWQVTGDDAAKQAAVRAAEELLGRYRLPGKYIQAWGPVGSEEEGGRIIADSMMNLPLLFWASEQTGDDRFKTAAYEHAKNCQTHLMRPDGSSYHTFFFNQHTGEPDRAETHQGYGDNSLWARGQAWAIYGFALAAEWCNDDSFLETAKQAAGRFMAELGADLVPVWDLRLPAGHEPLRDSSASSIAACGLLRIAELSGDATYKKQAKEQAKTLIQALIDTCLETSPGAQGLLKHGALHIPKGWAPDDYQIFGDYFFLEALFTLENKNPDFWGPAR